MIDYALGICNNKRLMPESPSDITGNTAIDSLLFIDEVSAGELTANPLAISPLVSTVSIGQAHLIVAMGEMAIPSAGSPNVGQYCDLFADGCMVSLLVASTSIGQSQSLSATGDRAEPVNAMPMIGQRHSITSIGIGASFSVSLVTITQRHALISAGVTSAPVETVPSIGQTNSLSPVGIVSDYVADSPSIGLNQTGYVLEAIGIGTDSPGLSSAMLGQIYALVPEGVFCELSTVGNPAILLIYNINGSAIAYGTPVIGCPDIEGPEALGKVCIRGVWYSIIEAKVSINETWRDIKSAKALIDSEWKGLSA